MANSDMAECEQQWKNISILGCRIQASKRNAGRTPKASPVSPPLYCMEYIHISTSAPRADDSRTSGMLLLGALS